MIKQNIKQMFEIQYSQLDDQSQIGKMDESFTPVLWASTSKTVMTRRKLIASRSKTL